jgi:MFS family permease
VTIQDKRTFLFALAVFTVSSFLCGTAWNIESLIGFRFLQGVGVVLTPVSTAMLFRAFPPGERAQAGALMTIPIVVAPASGPVLGGYLVEFHSWQWIFWINLPVGLLGLFVAAIYLREEKQEQPGRFDLPGFVLSGAGLATLLYALAEAGSSGFGDARVLSFGIAGLALLFSFAGVELRTRSR